MPQTLGLSRCRRILTQGLPLCATVLLLLGSCGPSGDGVPAGDAPPPGRGREAASGEASGQAAARWLSDVRLGRLVDAEGAVPASEQQERFAAGDPIYVSMEISSPPEGAAVHVRFEGPDGRTLAEDEKKAPAQVPNLYFDAGDTSSWAPGPYRAVVVADGQIASEVAFTLEPAPIGATGGAR